MDWIQKNYDRFALIVVAVLLMASSGFLALDVRQFGTKFSALQVQAPHGTKTKPLDTSALDQARDSLIKPAGWEGNHPGSLFVSRRYVVKENKLIAPEEEGILHPPVPNDWFVTNKLDLLENNILEDDTDGDGFSNLDEWTAKTDPNNKSSHPPLIDKLRLVRFIKQSFRLLFPAYDDESFQINTLDVRQPTQFVKLGQVIGGTKFKVLKFEHKFVPNPKTDGSPLDVSELTLQNTETGVQVVLVVDRVVDSPDSYAQFRCLLDNQELRVKKDQKFSLKVEPGVEYKLIDIQDTGALITNLKNGGGQIKVPRLEATSK